MVRSTGAGPAAADARAHVLVPVGTLDSSAQGDPVELNGDSHHHLARVLRLRTADPVTITDGHGRWMEARVSADFASSGALEVTGDVAFVAEPHDVGIAFALTKGEKPEIVVQKLTELGVRRIVAFRAARSVVRWDDVKGERNRQRLEAVAGAALQQSRGTWLPIVEPLTSLAALRGRTGVVRADRGGRQLRAGVDRLVVIGPEGGWADEERSTMPDAVGLPGQVLRAETAAIVGGAMLLSMWVDSLVLDVSVSNPAFGDGGALP